MIGFKTDLQKQYIVLFRDKIFKNIDKLCSRSAPALLQLCCYAHLGAGAVMVFDLYTLSSLISSDVL